MKVAWEHFHATYLWSSYGIIFPICKGNQIISLGSATVTLLACNEVTVKDKKFTFIHLLRIPFTPGTYCICDFSSTDSSVIRSLKKYLFLICKKKKKLRSYLKDCCLKWGGYLIGKLKTCYHDYKWQGNKVNLTFFDESSNLKMSLLSSVSREWKMWPRRCLKCNNIRKIFCQDCSSIPVSDITYSSS